MDRRGGRTRRGRTLQGPEQGARGPAWFNKPEVTVADPGREFAFNRKGPGIGSYTWRYRLEPIAAGTRVTESYEVERPLPKAMSWLTEKWTGSSDRDADLRSGMETTLARLKEAAEAR